jgi:hypothetical protein
MSNAVSEALSRTGPMFHVPAPQRPSAPDAHCATRTAWPYSSKACFLDCAKGHEGHGFIAIHAISLLEMLGLDLHHIHTVAMAMLSNVVSEDGVRSLACPLRPANLSIETFRAAGRRCLSESTIHNETRCERHCLNRFACTPPRPG